MSVKRIIGCILAAISILVVCQLLALSFARLLALIKVPAVVCNIIAGALYLGSAYCVLSLIIRKVLKEDLAEYGMPKMNIKLRWIIIAFLLPLSVQCVYILFFNGEFIKSEKSANDIATSLAAGIMFIGIAAGFVEEMIFRGVILNLLKEKWNIYVAVIVPSVLFGIVHIIGADFSIGSCLLVIVAGTFVGIMFSMIAIESGSVWNSGIVHALWNTLNFGFLYIGEEANSSSLFSYVLESKSFAITGGEFGIESSVISLIGYIIVTLIAFAMIKFKKKNDNLSSSSL